MKKTFERVYKKLFKNFVKSFKRELTEEELKKVREWARIGTAFILACREKNNA